MSDAPTFELIPIGRLRIHEEIRPELVERLVEEIRREGVVREPVWVARGTDVVLNGHHRFAALRALGAARVPAWVIDYDSDAVELGRWQPGPVLSKSEVVARAQSGRPYPPKTTRHTLRPVVPERPTPLAALGVRPAGSPRAPVRTGASAGASGGS
jgi:hypothetical protein